MLYHLNRRLFVENGPAALAERFREGRTTSDAFRVLRQAEIAALATCYAGNCTA